MNDNYFNPEPKFLVDFMLGRLAKWLRIIGYDSSYFVGNDVKELLWTSFKEQRIIITRTTHIAPRKAFKILVIKSTCFIDQLKEVIEKLNLTVKFENFFNRCSICNNILEKVKKESIQSKVPIYVYENHNEFSYCGKCEKVYWMGSHWELMKEKISSFITAKEGLLNVWQG